MQSLSKLFVIAAFPLLFWEGCYYDNYNELHPVLNNAPCDTNHTMSFAADIVPLLNTTCGATNSCHGSVNSSGYDLSTYSGVSNVVTNGSLVSSITWDGTVTTMPKDSPTKISVCDQTKIIKWVNAGAPNN